jgi:tRNA nucleotidyltransferase (CCA-adding enzyme)
MPDYIYLLANRLSPAQQSALETIREAAREVGMTVFLTGGAVRDLTSGSPVRDLDVSVQGDALHLKDKLKHAGAVLWGEHKPTSTIFLRFPGSVRVEISSTRSEEFPKPGKPVYHRGSILEDLRRRDFTANAMALSLNEGSYGLLMDPLNGVADLEARTLRLVSNYGFIEDPIRLIRAARLKARLGWELEEKTKTRFDTAREEGTIIHISAYQQGYEVEEIIHEEDGLKILQALESEGWMKFLFPAWTSAKADAESLQQLREVLVQLQMQGVNPDPSAAQAQLLTAKLPAKDLATLKKMFVRQGFVHEWETQDARSKEVAKRLTSKEAAAPSAAWKLLTSVDPEAVLWMGLTSKTAAVQEKLKDFFTVWPEARQRIPYAIMQEMRIVPELSGYQDLLRSIFFELIDGRLTTEEEIRQFLEPHSPPAPPPPVTIRRTRAKKSAEKHKDARDAEDEDLAEARVRREDEDGEEHEDSEDESGVGGDRAELIVRDIVQELSSPPAPVAMPAAVEEPGVPATGLKPTKKTVAVKPEAPLAKAKQPTEIDSSATRNVVTPAVAKTVSKPVEKAAKSAPLKGAVKTAVKPTAAKLPVKPAAKTIVKTKAAAKKLPAKAAVKNKIHKTDAKASVKPALKAAVKPAVGPAKKASIKPSAKPPVKSKPIKTAAKVKFVAAKAKLPAKHKPAAKGAAKSSPKSAAKPSGKSATVKKKR